MTGCLYPSLFGEGCLFIHADGDWRVAFVAVLMFHTARFPVAVKWVQLWLVSPSDAELILTSAKALSLDSGSGCVG